MYLTKNELDTVLSNDFDSLLSCSGLKKVKNWKIRYFWDFNSLFIDKEILDKPKKSQNRVWADGSVMIPEKSFDNHLSESDEIERKNPQVINPNQLLGVKNENYHEKYSGSTALMIWSLYNLPLPASEKGKMILLCVDSAFLGFYNESFRERHIFYLSEVFGFSELVEVEKRHSKEDFERLVRELKLKSLIQYEDGELTTELELTQISKELGLKIDLPRLDFTKIGSFQVVRTTLNQKIKDFVERQKNVFSIVFTRKNNLLVSYITEDYTKKGYIHEYQRI